MVDLVNGHIARPGGERLKRRTFTPMAKVDIIHVANIKLERTTGMGRIAWEWRSAALRRNFGFVHLYLFYNRSERKAQLRVCWEAV